MTTPQKATEGASMGSGFSRQYSQIPKMVKAAGYAGRPILSQLSGAMWVAYISNLPRTSTVSSAQRARGNCLGSCASDKGFTGARTPALVFRKFGKMEVASGLEPAKTGFADHSIHCVSCNLPRFDTSS